MYIFLGAECILIKDRRRSSKSAVDASLHTKLPRNEVRFFTTLRPLVCLIEFAKLTFHGATTPTDFYNTIHLGQ